MRLRRSDTIVGFASGGKLLSAQKFAKSVKGTPLKNPDFTGATQLARFSIDRHLLIEMANHLPRCRYIVIVVALCLCFGVPGAGLLCAEVFCTLGQRKLLASLVSDGLRAGRRSVLRWFYRRSSCLFGLGDLR